MKMIKNAVAFCKDRMENFLDVCYDRETEMFKIGSLKP